MPLLTEYRMKVEVRLVLLATDTDQPVGEVVVRTESKGMSGTSNTTPVQGMAVHAMEKATKHVKVMAAGLDQTERARLK